MYIYIFPVFLISSLRNIINMKLMLSRYIILIRLNYSIIHSFLLRLKLLRIKKKMLNLFLKMYLFYYLNNVYNS